MVRNIELGRRGEEEAARFLEARGFRIEARNVRTRFGEIDLIARDVRTVIFVEVKTRSSDESGMPLEAIPGRKAARLRRLAEAWAADHDVPDSIDLRIDCIGVVFKDAGAIIEHVEDAV